MERTEMITLQLDDRQRKSILFALYQFAFAAHARANAAAQDVFSKFYKASDVAFFLKDAEDAEALMAKIRELAK
jgi:hypothetical protein